MNNTMLLFTIVIKNNSVLLGKPKNLFRYIRRTLSQIVLKQKVKLVLDKPLLYRSLSK